ncbi:lasso peptide biosynthesis B2 protein [Paenibacillus dendritiformis]|uniref:lasso peptide biosynthesis B2 protein n=1 Tax=Paenibacillus dendritiformis TaxID=130049 RepID=UPI0018CD37AC|nr:lasso peptide biosynthesis B2 protein [Paenibacillus dendritiformis]
MSTYRLKDDLTFCIADERPIFLDTRKNRYFKLPASAERAFVGYINGTVRHPAEIRRLIELNILTDSAPSLITPEKRIPNPDHSSVELRSLTNRHGAKDAIETFAIVCWVQLYLKTRRLKKGLDALINFRRSAEDPGASSTKTLLIHAHAFTKSRALVPIATRCLLDSLAMSWFLARRGHYANIVFGVTSDPFSAHCWVQAGNLVLNDTIGNVRSYTIIRVI